jgi:lipopolysaccharide export system protein LptC
MKSLLNSKKAVLAGLLLVAGLAIWGLWGRRSPPPPPPPQTAPEVPARPKMESLSLTEVEAGGKRWTLEAQSAEYLKDRDEIRINDIQVEFFGERERALSLSCQEGLIHTKTRVLTLKGEVVLKDGDLTITTGLVRYLPKERVLIAPEGVVMESPRVKVQGKDLRVELAEKRLTLTHHQSTEVKMEGRKLPL